MGTTKALPKDPHGRSWRNDFTSIDATGSISVAFKEPQKDLAVYFSPPRGDKKPLPKAKPIVGIQLFDASNGKNPFSSKALELTQFGGPAGQKGFGTLILTVNYSNLNTAVIKHLFLSALDANGKVVYSSIDLDKPVGSTKKPFIYTAKKANTKSCRLIIEISEWPEGDPLISHG
jgi:hypothetical protein